MNGCQIQNNTPMLKILLTLVAISFIATNCSDKKILTQEDPKGKECLKGKVIRIFCAGIVVQVLNDDSIGEDGWKNTVIGDTNVYDNTINVGNTCKFPSDTKNGDIFYFTITKSVSVECDVCKPLVSTPKVKYDLLNISTTPCTDESNPK